MTKLATIRRIASDILSCGQNKVWLDPNETLRLTSATSREKIKELVTDNLIIKKPARMHSRYHARKRQAEVAKGRHRGPGKVRGTKNALDPVKKKWIARIRELRETLSKMREENNISKSEHKIFYAQAKGNMFKNKKMMVEYIEKKKDDERRMKELEEQAEALKMSRK